MLAFLLTYLIVTAFLWLYAALLAYNKKDGGYKGTIAVILSLIPVYYFAFRYLIIYY